MISPSRRPSALFVIREPRGSEEGGDRVHIRRMIHFLSKVMDLTVVSLEYGGARQRVIDLLRGWPVEVTGYYSRRNQATLADAMKSRPDYIYLIHESTFAFGALAADSGAKVILFSMNSISTLMSTGGRGIQTWLLPLARHYEQKFYRQTRALLTVVSRLDARALRETLKVDTRFPVVAPGILPPVALSPGAGVAAELVITGSYAWWRKRVDLKRFARTPPDIPTWVRDETAARILGSLAQVIPAQGLNWSEALRFGVITDRFLGGFKLKSLEYIGNNCIVLTCCDIRPEFDGLPHADEFVRVVSSAADIEREVNSVMARDADDVVRRFIEFQSACALRFDWDRCLLPLAPPFRPDPELDDASLKNMGYA